MKKAFLILLIFVGFSGFSQDFNAQFLELFQKKYDAKSIKELLAKWKRKAPEDVNYYIAGFNFYWNESKKEIVHLETQPRKDENLVLKDSLGKEVAYMYPETTYNDSLFTIAHKYIDEGIKLFPKRLDLRFGKIYSLGEMKKFDIFTNEILLALSDSKKINFEWLWSESKPLDNPITFFKSAVQDYQNTLFNEKQDANMKKIALEMVALFSEDEIVLSTLGTCYLIEENYSEALIIFLIANKINPTDTIILNNLGETYSKMNDKETAKKYFEQMLKIGDAETKKYAEQKLKALN